MVGPGHPYETHSPIWATTRSQKFDYGPPAPWAHTLMDAIRSQMLGPGQPYKTQVAVLATTRSQKFDIGNMSDPG